MQTRFDTEIFQEYQELVEAWERDNGEAYTPGGDLELWQFRNQYYEQFLSNCSNYMISMVVNDKFLAQDEDNQAILVERHDKVFTKQFYPDPDVQEERYVRFQAHTYEADNHFRWPSTHWIFRDRVSDDAGTAQAAAARRFLVRDREHVERQWPSDPVTYPYANISSPNYTSLVLDADLLTL